MSTYHPAPDNPECAQNKHRNCDGRAWDDDLDCITACGCPCHTDSQDVAA